MTRGRDSSYAEDAQDALPLGVSVTNTMWEERISRATHPSVLMEHLLRYRMALPLLDGSAVWADLGCGAGVAASAALDRRFDGCMVVVDNEEQAVASAVDELGDRIAEVVPLSLDLTSGDDLEQLMGELTKRAGTAAGFITCFEVIEHLDNFVPLLGALSDAAERSGYTVLLSVPNDSFWGLENPYHYAKWSGEAFEEFLRLMPEPRVVAHQVPLSGSAIVAGKAGTEFQLPVEVSMAGIPSHYLVAFGDRVDRITGAAEVRQTDLERQRSWERQREAQLEFLQNRENDLLWMLGECRDQFMGSDEGAANGSASRRSGRR